MSTQTFNTHRYIKHLKSGGIDEKQAEIHAEALDEALTDGVATKAQLDQVETKLETAMANMKTDILKWVFGFMIAHLGAVAWLIDKLVK